MNLPHFSQPAVFPPAPFRLRLRPALLVLALGGVLAASLVCHRARVLADAARARAAAEALAAATALERQFTAPLDAAQTLAMLVRQGGGRLPGFQPLAAELRAAQPALAALELLPGGVIADIAPRAGNERSLGANVFNDPARRAAALAAYQSRRVMVAGPFRLANGEPGFVAYVPVWLPGRDGREAFWGLVGAAVRFKELVPPSRLGGLVGRGYDFALFAPAQPGQPAVLLTAAGQPIRGDCVQQVVRAQNLELRLALRPRAGWYDRSDLIVSGLASLLGLGLLGGLLWTLRQRQDTTAEIVRVQAQLGGSRDRFRALFEAAPDALLITDRAGRIESLNPAAERLFGYARGELLGQPVEWLVPAGVRSTHPAQRDRYQRMPEAREMGAGLELAAVRKGGAEFPVEVRLCPLAGESGSELFVCSVVRDLTAAQEHQRLQAEWARTEVARQAEQEEGQELRTQVAALEARLAAVARPLEPEVLLPLALPLDLVSLGEPAVVPPASQPAPEPEAPVTAAPPPEPGPVEPVDEPAMTLPLPDESVSTPQPERTPEVPVPVTPEPPLSPAATEELVVLPAAPAPEPQPTGAEPLAIPSLAEEHALSPEPEVTPEVPVSVTLEPAPLAANEEPVVLLAVPSPAPAPAEPDAEPAAPSVLDEASALPPLAAEPPPGTTAALEEPAPEPAPESKPARPGRRKKARRDDQIELFGEATAATEASTAESSPSEEPTPGEAAAPPPDEASVPERAPVLPEANSPAPIPPVEVAPSSAVNTLSAEASVPATPDHAHTPADLDRPPWEEAEPAAVASAPEPPPERRSPARRRERPEPKSAPSEPAPDIETPGAPALELPVAEGLDTAAGLRQADGNSKHYLKLLRQFLAGHAGTAEELRDLLVQGESAAAERLAGGLKSEAGHVGAGRVETAAAALAHAIAALADPTEIEWLWADLEQALTPLLRELKRALKPAESESAPEAPPAASRSELRKAVHEILPLLAESDPGAAECLDANRGILRALFAPEAFARFEELVADSGFAEALELLRKAAKKQGI